MPTDYGSATINAATTTGPPGSPAVQPPIGWDRLTAGNTEMWNDHIGVELGSSVPQATQAVGQPNYPATLGTLGRDNLGALITWSTCVAGCTAGQTGTLTGSAFVVGAGSAVAQSTIPANGSGWVKN